MGSVPDLAADAAAELYGSDPEEFTERRKALAAAAKAAGDGPAAKRIAALRKPTRAAWVINRLARADPDAPARLASLTAALSAAEQAKDGRRLRELSATRGQLIDALTGRALAAAGVADPSAGLRDEVAATLTAALADPEVATAFAAGTLTRAAQWAGFGLALPSTAEDDDAAIPAAPPADRPMPLREGRSVREKGREGLEEASGAPGQSAGTTASLAEAKRGRQVRSAEGATARLDAQARERQAEAVEGRSGRLAEEAAQAAERRREIFEDAERRVASAVAARADAVAAEDRLEDEVRDLERRLTRARADLADARLRARRAEAAERKARQVLDRLPLPEDEA